MSDGCCCEFMLLFSEFISLTDFLMTEPLPILLLTCFYYELKGGESVLPLLGIIWQYLMHMRYDWKKKRLAPIVPIVSDYFLFIYDITIRISTSI